MNRISFDISNIKGRIKPLHGVNNGPVSRWNTVDTGVFYKQISPPFARLHDTNYPEAREIDIHVIFPDQSADPENPENYDFSMSDKYIRSITGLGTKIIYRLGESIATPDMKKYVSPPVDPSGYAKVCIGIIKHYNDGWADGMNLGIKHWEIWNEPTHPNMWTGTIDQWLELYSHISSAIREYDPHLMIGGPAARNPLSGIHDPFLSYIKSNSLPLDFYTCHSYWSNGAEILDNLEILERKLAEYGFSHLPVYITEWNYYPKPPPGKIFWDGSIVSDVVEKADLFERMNSSEGASYVSLFLSMLQNSYVFSANYYQTSTAAWFSCFSKYGVPHKSFYALKAFSMVHELEDQLILDMENTDLNTYAIASSDRNRHRILVTNFNSEKKEFLLTIPVSKFSKILCIDENHNLEPVDTYELSSQDLRIFMNKFSCILIELSNTH